MKIGQIISLFINTASFGVKILCTNMSVAWRNYFGYQGVLIYTATFNSRIISPIDTILKLRFIASFQWQTLSQNLFHRPLLHLTVGQEDLEDANPRGSAPNALIRQPWFIQTALVIPVAICYKWLFHLFLLVVPDYKVQSTMDAHSGT